jgi:hypothetical protein
MKRAFCSLVLTVLSMSVGVRMVLAEQSTKNPSPLPEEFTSRLHQSSLIFSPPKGFSATHLNPTNGVQWYDFAMKSNDGKLEVRYAIKPWRTNDTLNTETALLLAIVHNISQEGFGSTDVKGINLSSGLCDWLGADTGFITRATPVPEFSKDYRDCMVRWICAKGRGSAYTFYLFDYYAEVSDQIYNDSHSLRFIEKAKASR